MPWPVRVLLGLIVLLVLVALLFYPVENWRGHRAWEKCKRELAAKGESVNWDDFLPKPVPDEQNFFKAPHMTEWFVGRETNDLIRRLDESNLNAFTRRSAPNHIIELYCFTNSAELDARGSDLLVRFGASVLSAMEPDSAGAAIPQPGMLPLIIVQDTPLRDFVLNVVRQGNLKCVFDPAITYGGSDHPEPVVNYRQENVTLMQAMISVLNANGLQWIDDPKTGIARITRNDSGEPQIYIEPGVREQLDSGIQKALAAITNDLAQPSVSSADGFKLVPKPLGQIKPLRVAVVANKAPGLRAVAKFFPPTVTVAGNQLLALGVETMPGGFRVYLRSRPYAASEYLVWTDQLKPEFDAIRDALKRPYAQMDGDYRDPSKVPIPNYKALRSVARALAGRSECFLLLNEPERALHELTLLNNLCRQLEGKPTGRPMTFVALMLNGVVTELYAATIANGLRQHVWRDSQLVALQDQLKQIYLLPHVVECLRGERVASIHLLEFVRTNQQGMVFRNQGSGETFGRRFVPRGWWNQNYVRVADTCQMQIEGLDLTNNVVMLNKLNAAELKLEEFDRKFHPDSYMAALAMPNFTRGIVSVVRDQDMANQALFACALERYRIANGRYPDKLDALTPTYLEKLQHDIISGLPIKYHLTEDGNYVLYSVGSDGVDDGGTPAPTGTVGVEQAKGDWVWPSNPD